MLSADDYRNLRGKGFTHTLIEHLAIRDPQRLREMIDDPWRYPILGDPSAPVEMNLRENQHQALVKIEHDVMRLRQPRGIYG